MAEYINGYSYPQVLIQDINGVLIETIDLELCGVAGLTETITESFRRNELNSGAFVDFDFKGQRIIFNLDYSEYVRKGMLLSIQKIYSYHAAPLSYKILLRPRADNAGRIFEVRIQNPEFIIGILPGGSRTVGNRLFAMQFITKNFVEMRLEDPITTYAPPSFNVKSQ